VRVRRPLGLWLLAAAVLLSVFACTADGAQEPTPTGTPSPVPTVSMTCDEARDAIQNALDAYCAVHAEWPTADGQPGDLDWRKLVPAFLEYAPGNDSKCNWAVNSDPEGEVCVQNRC